MRNKILMTLALLLTAVTGAWAEEKMVTINSSTMSSGAVTATGFNIFDNYLYVNKNTATITTSEGVITKLVIKKYDGSYGDAFTEANVGVTPGTITYGSDEITVTDINAESVTLSRKGDDNWSTSSVDVYYAEPAIDVKWDAATKTGSFEMPAFDVEIAPIYAPVAQWAKAENVDQIPTAIEGIIAGEAKDIVKAGTVAKVGSTENAQGTLMYLVTTTKEQPTSTEGFSATVPTGAALTGSYTENQTVYVWYYIKGADTPQDQDPTAENTFNDSEICATPLQVTVLSNKFDIQFNAANANTIEAGKATVTVGGAAATVTEGKLEGVKMGTEVKLKANTGYKFRKVEVKKAAEAKPLANATTEDLGKVVGADGKIYATKADAEAVATGNAVAMICYVNEGHGLALALTDESDMDWSSAKTTCAAHTPAVTGATWKLASLSEMNLMINAAGNYAALRDGFSAVGGTNMIDEYYWLSDESTAVYAKNYNFGDGFNSQEFKTDNEKVRACLEW